MPTARAFHTATVMSDGRVLVAGGESDGSSRIGSADIFDPQSNKWTTTGSMAQPRSGAMSALLPDGRVIVVGGLGANTILASAEIYDPQTGTWSSGPSMTTSPRQRRDRHAALTQDHGRRRSRLNVHRGARPEHDDLVADR
jgi:N-acetylneuraminic acid mutarotase